MKKYIKILTLLLVLSTFIGGCGNNEKGDINQVQGEDKETLEETKPIKISGKQRLIIDGFDWGPGVVKTIISLDEEIDKEFLDKEKFEVEERKESFDWAKFTEEASAPDHIVVSSIRNIEDVYLSDEKGNKVDSDKGKYISIDLKVSPDEGNPFIYSMNTGLNNWCDPYELDIRINDENIDSVEIDSNIDLKDDKEIEIIGFDKFTYGDFTGSEGKKLTYASYEPEDNGKKKPLVIWLHGGGEGGSDPRIPLLANKAASFSGDIFQNSFEDGAYFLAPQAPTFWMDIGEGKRDESTGLNSSTYNVVLKELIDKYVEDNPNIDPKRILIGGCSNGGFMTFDMIMTYSDYFAGGFPVCPPYEAKNVSGEELSNIKNVPIWMVYAKTDTTIDPLVHEETMDELFKNTDMKDYRKSVFEDVHDTSGAFKNEDGSPYEYNGHWSWIYVYNNEVASEDGMTLFNWLASQSN